MTRTTSHSPVTVLARDDWTARAQAHTDRITGLVGPYLADRGRGERHPVIDFLFTYYSARPSELMRWHPGFGIALADGAAYAGRRGYGIDDAGRASVTSERLAKDRGNLEFIVPLLRATAVRPPRLGCFGLHEWAMVYRTDETRHAYPLRLGVVGTDAVVEASGLRCTHFDAFRFFTESARPRNPIQLTRADAIKNEQPGCLHATMDLYRYSLRLAPLVGSDLLADAFELAVIARELDMRASPYDLSGVLDMHGHPYSPVTIENPEGRAEYVRQQTAIAERGAVVRAALIKTCCDLLHHRSGQ